MGVTTQQEGLLRKEKSILHNKWLTIWDVVVIEIIFTFWLFGSCSSSSSAAAVASSVTTANGEHPSGTISQVSSAHPQPPEGKPDDKSPFLSIQGVASFQPPSSSSSSHPGTTERRAKTPIQSMFTMSMAQELCSPSCSRGRAGGVGGGGLLIPGYRVLVTSL